jgi:hypothetical protein
MAWSTPSSRSTGNLITATIWNQDVVDNPVAMRSGAIAIASQAALDFIYGSAATQLARLAAGAAHTSPRINAAGTAWEFFSTVLYSGLIDVDDTQQAVTSGTDQVVRTYQVPSNYFAVAGRTLLITAFGTFAANANSKTVRIRWGGLAGTVVTSLSHASSTGIGWRMSGLIVRIGTDSQRVIGIPQQGTGNITTSDTVVTTAALAEASAQDLVVTGDGVAASDIVYEGSIVQSLGLGA